MVSEYPDLADQWDTCGCYQSPSALQGWLTGYLASGARLTTSRWLEEAMDYLELDELPTDLQTTLSALYDQVLAGLQAEDMAYEPLLPDDEEADIIEQIDCLAQWSKGFLDGIGASGKLTGSIDSDVMEVLRDLDAFSQAEAGEIADAEAGTLYLELAEHARVAALTVFYAFNKSAPGAQVPEVLH
ncbi:MAG TPA: hypothetical protein DEA26_10275 [Oceanospirillales bacterium]|nr:hypothetical protein [Oceanospirillaceae bacterium]HBS43057.1 hypothetical protein [Oceanospirillales bacterium]|tara:strand:- start:13372 stop:13929 length:558 start_codon:yes stop_codon:yes gene_type:complete